MTKTFLLVKEKIKAEEKKLTKSIEEIKTTSEDVLKALRKESLFPLINDSEHLNFAITTTLALKREILLK